MGGRVLSAAGHLDVQGGERTFEDVIKHVTEFDRRGGRASPRDRCSSWLLTGLPTLWGDGWGAIDVIAANEERTGGPLQLICLVADVEHDPARPTEIQPRPLDVAQNREGLADEIGPGDLHH